MNKHSEVQQQKNGHIHMWKFMHKLSRFILCIHTVHGGGGRRSRFCGLLAAERHSWPHQVNLGTAAGVWTQSGVLIEVQLTWIHDLPVETTKQCIHLEQTTVIMIPNTTIYLSYYEQFLSALYSKEKIHCFYIFTWKLLCIYGTYKNYCLNVWSLLKTFFKDNSHAH